MACGDERLPSRFRPEPDTRSGKSATERDRGAIGAPTGSAFQRAVLVEADRAHATSDTSDANRGVAHLTQCAENRIR